MSIKNKLAIYCQIIRPIITYAAPVWKNISKQRKKEFQVFQNKTLKMCLGLHPRTHTTYVHEKTNIPLLSEYIEKLDQNFRASSNSSKYLHIRNIFL